MIAKIQAWDPEADIEFPYAEQPYRASRNSSVIRALLRGIRAEDGEPRFKLKTGTSDMNVVGPAWKCPLAAYGPGDSTLDHTPEEHILLDEYLGGIRVLEKDLIYWTAAA